MAVRIGIIGGGSIARVHLMGYAAIDEVAAAKVADVSPNARESMRQQPKVEAVVEDGRVIDNPISRGIGAVVGFANDRVSDVLNAGYRFVEGPNLQEMRARCAAANQGGPVERKHDTPEEHADYAMLSEVIYGTDGAAGADRPRAEYPIHFLARQALDEKSQKSAYPGLPVIDIGHQ